VAPNSRPERNPLGVVAEQDDLLGAKALGCDHAAETDGAVADDGDRFPRPDPGADGRVVARSHHIREREQRRHQGVVSADRQHDERSVRLRDAYGLALTAIDVIEAVPASVETFALQPLPAEDACSIGPQKRRHDHVARLDRVDVGADVLDHPDEFVAHALARFGRFHRLVRPQVAPADRRPPDTHERICCLDQMGIWDGLDANVAGAVHQGRLHGENVAGNGRLGRSRDIPERWPR
jgi:hypothetical protein